MRNDRVMGDRGRNRKRESDGHRQDGEEEGGETDRQTQGHRENEAHQEREEQVKRWGRGEMETQRGGVGEVNGAGR